MLVTLTPRLRVHHSEVICALVKGNSLLLRFVSMKPMRIPVDDLTEEARQWLLPSLAPRGIPVEDQAEYEEEEVEAEAEVNGETEIEKGHPGRIQGN